MAAAGNAEGKPGKERLMRVSNPVYGLGPQFWLISETCAHRTDSK